MALIHHPTLSTHCGRRCICHLRVGWPVGLFVLITQFRHLTPNSRALRPSYIHPSMPPYIAVAGGVNAGTPCAPMQVCPYGGGISLWHTGA